MSGPNQKAMGRATVLKSALTASLLFLSASGDTISFNMPPAQQIRPLPTPVLKEAVTPLLEAAIKKINAPGISFAFHGPGGVSFTATAGKIANDSSARAVNDTDRFVYGSGTKMYTMAGIMQLVAAGNISLDDPAHEHIDPLLMRANGTTLAELWGVNSGINLVTVQDLLAMRSGISDYTLEPWLAVAFEMMGSFHLDPFTILHKMNKTLLYRAPDLPKGYATYSSSNYLLLGLLLASKAGAANWSDYDFRNVLGKSLSALPSTVFGMAGPLSDYTEVRGYMCEVWGMLLNHTCKYVDVSGLSALQGSYGCGNLIAPPSEVARFVFDLYGPGSGPFANASAAAEARTHMVNFNSEQLEIFTPYGFGTEWLGDIAGTGSFGGLPPSITYGHGGEAYGMLTISAYIPMLQAGVSWAVNVLPGGAEAAGAGLVLASLTCNTWKVLAAAWGAPTSSYCRGLPPVDQQGAAPQHPTGVLFRRSRRWSDTAGPLGASAVHPALSQTFV